MIRLLVIGAAIAIAAAACQPEDAAQELQSEAKESSPDAGATVAQQQEYARFLTQRTQGPDPEECSQRGGQIQRGVRIGNGGPTFMVCVVHHADADKECTDSSQCEGACLVWESDIREGEAAVGECQAETPIQSGCYASVVGGIVKGPGLCMN